MSRAIVVMSLPRSGSSAVAGSLHRMGVNMGQGTMQPADVLNQQGYYEDLRWQRLHKALAGIRYATEEKALISERMRGEYRNLIRKSAARSLVWGFKGPRACFTMQHVWPLFGELGVEVRVVVVQRAWQATVESLKRHSEIAYNGRFKMSLAQAETLADRWMQALAQRLVEFGELYPERLIHEVRFEDLVADIIPTLLALELFCFDGEYEQHSKGVLRAAKWIDPELVNFGDVNHPHAEPSGGDADGGAGVWKSWYPKRKADCGCCP